MNKQLVSITVLLFTGLVLQNILSNQRDSDEFQQWKLDYAASF